MDWETGIDIYTLSILRVKQTTNDNLLDSTGNSTQRPVVAYMARKSTPRKKREDMCICIAGLLCCAAETNTTL